MSSPSKIISPDSAKPTVVRYKRRARKTVPARFIKKMTSQGSHGSSDHTDDPVTAYSTESDDVLNAVQEDLPPVLLLQYGSWSDSQKVASSKVDQAEEEIPIPITADSVDEEIRVSTQEDSVSEKIIDDSVLEKEEVVPSAVRVDEEIEITNVTVADMFESAKIARDQRREARKRKKIEGSSKVSSKKRKGS
jgi:hypothetical protein